MGKNKKRVFSLKNNKKADNLYERRNKKEKRKEEEGKIL